MTRIEIAKNLAKITDSFLDESERSHDFGMRLHVPYHLAEEHTIDRQSALVLVDEEHTLYDKCLTALLNDVELEYLDERQIKEALRDIIWHVYIKRSELRDRRKRIRCIQHDLETLAKPTETYRFMFVVNDLATIESSITIDGVTLQTLTDDMVEYWITRREGIEKSHLPAEVGSVIALVEADGASATRTAARAAATVENALDELRLAISTFPFRIWDFEIRFSRGNAYVGTTLPNEDTFYRGWRNSSDIPLKLSGRLLQSTTEYLELLSFVHSTDIAVGIRDRLVRAIDWTGQSIVRVDPDDKVVDLCTTLECLLTTKADRRKGDAIAIRMMTLAELVKDGFRHPSDTLFLYELRSRIVHGSARNVCTDSDYMSLRSLVLDVIEQILELLKRDKSITRHSKLISAVTKPELLEKCISWLDAEADDLSKDLKEYAEGLRNQHNK